uniref:Uncharacterized protein n=1 Tax=Pyxicephalus adspersus TaxID=30357 RepID=A0AAV3AII2_PYXAD|nr:TPA: hypothetical protein GDO54_012641 [Pyxicephalus adspersus]
MTYDHIYFDCLSVLFILMIYKTVPGSISFRISYLGLLFVLFLFLFIKIDDCLSCPGSEFLLFKCDTQSKGFFLPSLLRVHRRLPGVFSTWLTTS